MDPFGQLLGESDAAEAARRFGRLAAGVDAPVLLTGESGTGKGLLARAIHAASGRHRGPFVAINCAGVPETLFESQFFGHDRGAFTGAQQQHRGLFEQAHRGTLFLDEIGELAPTLQAKLLTALEDGEIRRVGGEVTIRVDARVVAATGRDLEAAVASGTFRRDLFHRLHVLSFRLPALRERATDLDLLIAHYLDHYRGRYGRAGVRFEPAALDRLRRYPWPGNVRELAHAVEAALLRATDGRIGMDALPAALRGRGWRGEPRPVPAPRAEPAGGRPTTGNGAAAHAPNGRVDRVAEGNGHAALHPANDPGAGRYLPDANGSVAGTPAAPDARRRYSFWGSAEEERRRILDTLRLCHGNKTRAAAALGMSRNTLRARLRAWGAAD